MSLVKRRYSPGYHLEVVKHHPRREHPAVNSSVAMNRVENELVPLNITRDSIAINKTPVQKVNVLTKQSTFPAKLTKHQHPKTTLQDSCDVVYMVTGERINAIVIEIGENYVSYKKCDDLKGRLYTVKTKMINNITLRNGEYFIPKDSIIVDKDKERKKSNTLFIMSIVAISLAAIALLLSFFIGAAAAISFTLSLIDIFFTPILMLINIRPSRFAPSYRTKFTWILCLIALILIIGALIVVLI
jgi:hypothetical protein